MNGKTRPLACGQERTPLRWMCWNSLLSTWHLLCAHPGVRLSDPPLPGGAHLGQRDAQDTRTPRRGDGAVQRARMR